MAYAVSPQVSGFLEQVDHLRVQFEAGVGKGDVGSLIAMQERAARYVQIGGDLLVSERAGMGSSDTISEAVAIAGSIQDAFTQRITELVSSSVETAPLAARTILPITATAASKAIGAAPVYHTPERASSNISRRFPPLGSVDTIRFRGGVMVSAHGTANVFKDEEIIAIHGVVSHKVLGKNTEGANVFADYTKRGKAIIQQQATRGCTAGATAMLIMDNGGTPNISNLIYSNLGTDEMMFRDLRDAGLTPATTSYKSLRELKDCLERCGSLICSMDVPGCGSHVIVVDAVSDDLSSVRIRDPYHGWEISVRADAFNRYAGKSLSDCIYVVEGIPR